uniref:Uncharacterized protein n=1 Tax=Arundo donax TaxID=35708 RepID=A0A0A9FPM0_ARUDO
MFCSVQSVEVSNSVMIKQQQRHV